MSKMVRLLIELMLILIDIVLEILKWLAFPPPGT